MYPQIILLVWGSRQYMEVYLVYNASIAPPTYVNMCYIYRLRYVYTWLHVVAQIHANLEYYRKSVYSWKLVSLSNWNVSSLLALSLWAVRRRSGVLLCREDILRFLLSVHGFLGEDDLGNTWPRHLKHGVQQQCLLQKCQEKGLQAHQPILLL